jgi:hypothetical protein
MFGAYGRYIAPLRLSRQPAELRPGTRSDEEGRFSTHASSAYR